MEIDGSVMRPKHSKAYLEPCLTAQKMKFSIKDFLTADLVTFTEEILNGSFHFLCSAKHLTWSIDS